MEEALDKRTSMGVIGNMTTYTQMQFADSLKDAANNPTGGGNLAGDAMGAGIGLAMAGKMAQEMVGPQATQNQNNTPTAPQQGTPPPMPQQAMYHVAIDGVQQGPFASAQLEQMVQQRQITPDTLVWTQGMAGWEAAKSVSSIASLFGAVPPPL